jgi:DNA-binding transcriptional ArsR family regulator
MSSPSAAQPQPPVSDPSASAAAYPTVASPQGKHSLAVPHRDGKLIGAEVLGWSSPQELGHANDADHQQAPANGFMLDEDQSAQSCARGERTVDPSTIDALSALADPIRLELARRLAAGPCSVRRLAEGFNVSRAAISQHLKVLLKLGMVSYRRHGPLNIYSLEPEPILRLQAQLNELSRNALASARRWQRQAVLLERL